MKQGAVVIIVQGEGNCLSYARMAADCGVRVVIVGVQEMEKIGEDTDDLVLSAVEKYCPREDAE
jgi:hypothetical protein